MIPEKQARAQVASSVSKNVSAIVRKRPDIDVETSIIKSPSRKAVTVNRGIRNIAFDLRAGLMNCCKKNVVRDGVVFDEYSNVSDKEGGQNWAWY